jgi:hypothetical protein
LRTSEPKKEPKIVEELDFTTMPRHLFVHPFIFGTLQGKGTSSAKSLATKIIKRLQLMKREVEPGDEEQIKDFIEGTLIILAFLWAINQGLVPPILLSNPPKADGVNEACNQILERLCSDKTESLLLKISSEACNQKAQETGESRKKIEGRA